MKVIYQADDGAMFNTEEQCKTYENNTHGKLTRLVNKACDSTFNQDAGFSIIEPEDVATFILDNSEVILEILNSRSQY